MFPEWSSIVGESNFGVWSVSDFAAEKQTPRVWCWRKRLQVEAIYRISIDNATRGCQSYAFWTVAKEEYIPIARTEKQWRLRKLSLYLHLDLHIVSAEKRSELRSCESSPCTTWCTNWQHNRKFILLYFFPILYIITFAQNNSLGKDLFQEIN